MPELYQWIVAAGLCAGSGFKTYGLVRDCWWGSQGSQLLPSDSQCSDPKQIVWPILLAAGAIWILILLLR